MSHFVKHHCAVLWTEPHFSLFTCILLFPYPLVQISSDSVYECHMLLIPELSFHLNVFSKPNIFKIKICDNFRIFSLDDPLDCTPPGSSVYGVVQAWILEWVAMPSSRGSSWPRDHIFISYISCIGRQVLYHWNLLGSPMISEFFGYRYSFSHFS